MGKELQIGFETPMLAKLAEELAAQLGSGKREGIIFNKHMLQSLKEAMKPGVTALKNATPKGPTGNLRRSVKIITRNYRKDRKWFAAVGYSAHGRGKTKINKSGRRTGSDLGYHQGLVEAGTTGMRRLGRHQGGKQVRIATSFRYNSSLKISTNRFGQVGTKPAPPKGFFTSATLDRTVELRPMKGEGNIPKVYAQVNSSMRSALAKDMETRVGKAVRDLKKWNERSPIR